MASASVGISMLLLAHDKCEYSRRCLDSLFLSTLRPFQVVLVDNGSRDATPEVFDAFQQRASRENIAVSRLRFDDNVGAIVGRNCGMEMMTGRYWVFLDNDVTVRTRSWLEKLLAVLDAEPRVGVVAPKLVYPLAPHLIQCAGCDVTSGGRVIFRGRGSANQTPAYNTRCDCQTLISAVWLMRAELARQIGPLDARFSPVQFEDIDYCYRMRETGWLCRYEPGVEMYHFENVTTAGTTLNYPYLTVKNGLKFKEKWRHRFAHEGGPPDRDWAWAEISTVALTDVPEQLETLP
jgi:O-antigen biosynthesis protein